MKNHIFLVLLFCTHTCFGSAIDSIKTKRDVITFLDKHLPDRRIDIDENDTIEESHEWIFSNNDNRTADSFYIVDFDRNGRNDLIVDGRSFYVILDLGKGNYKNLHQYGPDLTYKGIRRTDTGNHLLVHVDEQFLTWPKRVYDTVLLYKFGALVEHVPFPDKYTIDSIDFRYQAGQCRGCELFSLRAIIRKDGSAAFYYDLFGRAKTLKTSTILPAAEVQYFWNMLDHMRFEKLPEEFGKLVLHSSTFQLKMYYNNGKTKKTSVWSGFTPFTLSTLFTSIRDSYEKLHRTDEPVTEKEEMGMLILD